MGYVRLSLVSIILEERFEKHLGFRGSISAVTAIFILLEKIFFIVLCTMGIFTRYDRYMLIFANNRLLHFSEEKRIKEDKP
jgi:hypothetical protein